MAGLNLVATTAKQSLISTAKWALTITAPAHQRVKIKSIELFGFGTSNTDTPLELDMTFITTDGETGTATAVTPTAEDQDLSETPQATVYKMYGTAPTTPGATVRSWSVHPQTGLAVFFPLGQEIIIKGGGEIGFLITPNQAESWVLNVGYEE